MRTSYKKKSFLKEKDTTGLIYQTFYDKVKFIEPALLSYTSVDSLVKDIMDYLVNVEGYDIEYIETHNPDTYIYSFVDNMIKNNNNFRKIFWEDFVLGDIAYTISEEIRYLSKDYVSKVYERCNEYIMRNKKKFVVVNPKDILYEPEIVQVFKNYNEDLLERDIAKIIEAIVVNEDIPIYEESSIIKHKKDEIFIYIGTLTLDDEDFAFDLSKDLQNVLQNLSDKDIKFLNSFNYKNKGVTKIDLEAGVVYFSPFMDYYRAYVSLTDIEPYIKNYV